MVEGFTDSDDKKMISDVKRGDFKSINKFYKVVKPQFVKWCFKNYKLNSFEVEDLFQDAFELLYKKIVLNKVDKIESSVKTYFFGICKYKIYEKFRETKVESLSLDGNVLDEQKGDFLLIAEDEEEQNISAILDCKKKLSLLHQSILSLYYEEKKSMKEIALALDYKNEDVVKSQKARCILQLKKCVKNKLKLIQS